MIQVQIILRKLRKWEGNPVAMRAFSLATVYEKTHNLAKSLLLFAKTWFLRFSSIFEKWKVFVLRLNSCLFLENENVLFSTKMKGFVTEIPSGFVWWNSLIPVLDCSFPEKRFPSKDLTSLLKWTQVSAGSWKTPGGWIRLTSYDRTVDRSIATANLTWRRKNLTWLKWTGLNWKWNQLLLLGMVRISGIFLTRSGKEL